MTDGITWLAAPQSIAFGGYSVVFARGLDAGELVSRLTATLFTARTPVSLGRVTSKYMVDAVADEQWGPYPLIGLRYGEIGEWVFVVKYGGWPAEFDSLLPVSRDGAHVFQVEFEEENGKLVPPQFSYCHDERFMCFFNLHLDDSWGYQGVSGDPEVAARVEEMLAAAGLPNPDVPRRETHRMVLGIIERCFGLSLPHPHVLETALPAVLLEVASAD